MRRTTLIILLSLSLMVAVTPLLVWTVAAMTDAFGEPGFSALGVTVPVGLALAALTFAAHGLLLNRDLEDRLEVEYDAIAETFAQPADPALVGAGVAPTAPASAGAVAAPTVELPVTASPPAPVAKAPRKPGKSEDKIRKVGKRAGESALRRGKSKARFTAQRELRKAVRGLDPRH